MSYDISFKVKVEGADVYVDVGNCDANITWNLRQMIVKSTGLEWKNGDNNGYCVDVIPHIERGLAELSLAPEKYKQYEAPNGWGTIEGCKRFFQDILDAWHEFKKYQEYELVNLATFWIY